MRVFEEIKKWVGQITEVGLLLIALGVVVEILFGEAVPFFGKIATNLTGLLHSLGEHGFAGLIAAGIIVFLFYRKIGLPIADTGTGKQAPPARKARRSGGKRVRKSR